MASTVLPNGIIVPEKFSRDWYADLYHNWQELDNLLGGGGANDGTLTIQKNGTTVGTFSANQATDETVNIEVPTATSELTNDSGYITGVSWDDVTNKPSFATVATSGSYNDLSNKPTIPTVNNATLTIQKNGTTIDTFTANSSTDKTVNVTVPTKTSDLNNDSGFITSEIDSSGTGWVRFTSGLQICWVQVRLSDSVYNWNFPKTFLENPGVTATIYYGGSNVNAYQRSIEINLITSTGVSLRSANHQFGSNSYIAGSDYVNAIAIGMWK